MQEKLEKNRTYAEVKKLRKGLLKIIFFRYISYATSILKVSSIFKPIKMCRNRGLKHD